LKHLGDYSVHKGVGKRSTRLYNDSEVLLTILKAHKDTQERSQTAIVACNLGKSSRDVQWSHGRQSQWQCCHGVSVFLFVLPGGYLTKWRRRQLLGPFLALAQADGFGDYLVNTLEPFFWPGEEKTLHVVGVRPAKARLPMLSVAALTAAVTKLGESFTTAQCRTAASNLLRSLRVPRHVEVVVVVRVDEEEKSAATHTVSFDAEGRSSQCDCWHFLGQRMVCQHLFFVARSILDDAVVAESEARWAVSSTTSTLLGYFLSEVIGQNTQWFTKRSGVRQPAA
jgi:hypothetical protein